MCVVSWQHSHHYRLVRSLDETTTVCCSTTGYATRPSFIVFVVVVVVAVVVVVVVVGVALSLVCTHASIMTTIHNSRNKCNRRNKRTMSQLQFKWDYWAWTSSLAIVIPSAAGCVTFNLNHFILTTTQLMCVSELSKLQIDYIVSCTSSIYCCIISPSRHT